MGISSCIIHDYDNKLALFAVHSAVSNLTNTANDATVTNIYNNIYLFNKVFIF